VDTATIVEQAEASTFDTSRADPQDSGSSLFFGYNFAECNATTEAGESKGSED
jgi:hypothetical protein